MTHEGQIMKVWVVESWADHSSEVVAVCVSEELALEFANKLATDHEEDVTWEVHNEIIYGTLTYQGDECSAGLIIKCWEVDGG